MAATPPNPSGGALAGTPIPAIPVTRTYVAFNPTDITASSQTWTEVSNYVRDGSTRGGRQHYLDRIESSVLSLTLDNRDGFFFNGTFNGTGKTLRARLPIKVEATWSGTTYSVFRGVIDSVEPRNADALNSDLTVNATDSLKYLSLQYLYNPDLYGSIGVTPRSLYLEARRNSLIDSIGGQNGKIKGSYASTDGVVLFDTTNAIDLTNGSDDTNTADISIPVGTFDEVVEFWIIGQLVTNVTLIGVEIYTSLATDDYSLRVDGNGRIYTNPGTFAPGITTPTPINDGYWHHVAVGLIGGSMYVLVDGVAYGDGVSWGAGYLLSTTGTSYQIANTAIAYVDRIAVTSSGGLVTINDITNRYIAGYLLREDRITGDRVAEVLAICGYATITGGTISAPTLFVDDPTNTIPFVYGGSKNGTCYAQGLLDNVTSQTGLDVILTVSDTEIGIFFQDDSGKFQYRTRAYSYNNAAARTSVGTIGDNNSTPYHYATNISILYDDVDLWTNVIVSPQNGTPQTYRSGNDALYGGSTLTKSGTLDVTLDAAQTTAQYLGYIFQSPLPRVNSLELRSATNNGSNLPLMLGLNIQDRVTIQRAPTNAVALNTDMVVESINHEFASEPGYWQTSVTLDPYPIRNTTQDTKPYFILNDSTFGKLDGTNYLL